MSFRRESRTRMAATIQSVNFLRRFVACSLSKVWSKCQETLLWKLKDYTVQGRPTCSFYKVGLHHSQQIWVPLKFLVFKHYVTLLSGKSCWRITKVSTDFMGWLWSIKSLSILYVIFRVSFQYSLYRSAQRRLAATMHALCLTPWENSCFVYFHSGAFQTIEMRRHLKFMTVYYCYATKAKTQTLVVPVLVSTC